MKKLFSIFIFITFVGIGVAQGQKSIHINIVSPDKTNSSFCFDFINIKNLAYTHNFQLPCVGLIHFFMSQRRNTSKINFYGFSRVDMDRNNIFRNRIRIGESYSTLRDRISCKNIYSRLNNGCRGVANIRNGKIPFYRSTVTNRFKSNPSYAQSWAVGSNELLSSQVNTFSGQRALFRTGFPQCVSEKSNKNGTQKRKKSIVAADKLNSAYSLSNSQISDDEATFVGTVGGLFGGYILYTFLEWLRESIFTDKKGR